MLALKALLRQNYNNKYVIFHNKNGRNEPVMCRARNQRAALVLGITFPKNSYSVTENIVINVMLLRTLYKHNLLFGCLKLKINS